MPELVSIGFEPIAITLPGHAPRSGNGWLLSMEHYGQAICDKMREIGAPIPVVAHSSGGLAVVQAAEMDPSLFSKLIFLTALVPPRAGRKGPRNIVNMMKGASTADGVPKAKGSFHPLAGTGMVDEKTAIAQFYSTLAPDLPISFFELLTPEPIRPMFSNVEWTTKGMGSVPRAYVECTEDRAVDLDRQMEWQQNGEFSEIYSIKSGHTLFAEKPRELAGLLLIAVNSA